ncbi:MAG TPA: hypothetical protein VGN23_02410 [Verrucomicrobiae bacterium]|jgi:hypothetical protein
MKKFIPLLAVPFILAGCGNNTSSTGDTNGPAEMNTNIVAPADTNLPGVNTNADMAATNAPSVTGVTNTPP